MKHIDTIPDGTPIECIKCYGTHKKPVPDGHEAVPGIACTLRQEGRPYRLGIYGSIEVQFGGAPYAATSDINFTLNRKFPS